MIQVIQSVHQQAARDIQVEDLHVRLTYQPQARGHIAMTACRTVCAQLNPFGAPYKHWIVELLASRYDTFPSSQV